MASAFGASDAVTNGTTAVDAVAAPGAAVRRVVRGLTVYNADSVSHAVTVQLVSGANTRRRYRQTVAAGSSFVFGEKGEIMVLDATTKKVQVKLDAAHTTNALEVAADYVDFS